MVRFTRAERAVASAIAIVLLVALAGVAALGALMFNPSGPYGDPVAFLGFCVAILALIAVAVRALFWGILKPSPKGRGRDPRRDSGVGG